MDIPQFKPEFLFRVEAGWETGYVALQDVPVAVGTREEEEEILVEVLA